MDAWDKRQDLVLWEDLEGAGGEGGGRGDRDGEDMWTQGLFISMYDKIHYKKKKKNCLFRNIWAVVTATGLVLCDLQRIKESKTTISVPYFYSTMQ